MGHRTVEPPSARTGKLKPLSEQVVVIIGASSGIGRETALQMARRGTRLVVAARDGQALSSLVEAVNAERGDAIGVIADTSEMTDVQHVADVSVERYGGFDTWVQAAAVAVYARFEDTTPEEFRRVLDVNVLGNVHGARVAPRQLQHPVVRQSPQPARRQAHGDAADVPAGHRRPTHPARRRAPDPPAPCRGSR